MGRMYQAPGIDSTQEVHLLEFLGNQDDYS